jgi:hypothetical protein
MPLLTELKNALGCDFYKDFAPDGAGWLAEFGRPRPQQRPKCHARSPTRKPSRSATLLRPGTGALRPGRSSSRCDFFSTNFLTGAKSKA